MARPRKEDASKKFKVPQLKELREQEKEPIKAVDFTINLLSQLSGLRGKLSPDVMLARTAPEEDKDIQALTALAGDNQQLQSAIQAVGRRLYEHNLTKVEHYKNGMVDGFKACWALLRNWPEDGTLAHRVWELWKEHPTMKNERLCLLLDKSRIARSQLSPQYRKDIEKAIKQKESKPVVRGEVRKTITFCFEDALQYSHPFEKWLSEQRKAFDEWTAADKFYRREVLRQRITPEKQQKKTIAQLRAERKARIDAELGLTAEQRTRLQEVYKAAGERFRSARNDPTITSDDAWKEKQKEIREYGRTQMAQFLTPEQLQKIQRYLPIYL